MGRVLACRPPWSSRPAWATNWPSRGQLSLSISLPVSPPGWTSDKQAPARAEIEAEVERSDDARRCGHNGGDGIHEAHRRRQEPGAAAVTVALPQAQVERQ